MKFLILALVAISVLATPALTQERDSTEARPFRISSMNTAFGVQAQIDGDYVVERDRIRLRIAKAEILDSTHCPYKGRRQLTQLSIDLVTRIEGRRWKTFQKGQNFLLGNVMSPGDKFELYEVILDIPLNETIDLSKYWLVLRIEEVALDVADERQRVGFSFAHSACDIFGQAGYEARARQK